MMVAYTEADIDAFHGHIESRSFDLKRDPPRTDDLVRHIQGGANGIKPVFRILIGAVENPPGVFDKNTNRPLIFPLSVDGIKNPFQSFDAYRNHLVQTVRSQTDGYFEGFFEIHDVAVRGGSLILIEVAQSMERPHQNTKSHSYFIRGDGQTRRMADDELDREMAARRERRTETGADSVSDDLFERPFFLPGDVVVDASDNAFAGGTGEIRLADGPQLYLRLIPREKPSVWTASELRKLHERSSTSLHPFGPWTTANHHRNALGILVWRVFPAQA